MANGDDVAVLGISIDSSQVVRADSALDDLTNSSQKAEKATDSLSGAAKKGTPAFTSYGTEVESTAKAAIQFNQRVDRLSKAFDLQRVKLEQGGLAYRELAAAQKLGLDSAEQLPPALRRQIAELNRVETEFKEATTASRAFEAELRKTEKATSQSSSSINAGSQSLDRYSRGLKQTSVNFQGFSRNAGQGAIQIQQFVGQVQGGTDFLVAFSQQAADLGIVLGAPLTGAIAGIAGALGTALLPALFESKDATEELEAALEALDRTVTESDGVTVFTERVRELAQQSETAARLLLIAAEQSARDAGEAAATGIGEAFNDAFDVTTFQRSFDSLVAIAGTAGAQSASISSDFRELGEQFGLTGVAAREAGAEILISLRGVQQSIQRNLPDSQEQINAFQENLFRLSETASGEGRENLLRFVNSIQEYLDNATTAAERTRLLQKALSDSNGVVEEIVSNSENLVEAQGEITVTLDELVDLINQETEAYEQGGDALREYVAERQAIEILTRTNNELTAESIALLKEEILERNRAREASRQFTREVKNSTNEIERAYDRLTDSVSGAFEDLFRSGLRGFDDFADTAVNIVETMIARMLAEIATAELSKALDLGSLVGASSGTSGAISGAVGGGDVSSVVAGLGSTAGLAQAAFIAAALPQVVRIVDGLRDFVFEGGSLSDALRETIVGRALLGGNYQTTSSGIQFGVSGGAFGAQSFENQRRSGGLFSSSRSRTLTNQLDVQTQEAFNAAFDNISDTVIGGLQTLGFDIADNALDSFNSGLRQVDFGENEQENQAAVQRYFDNLSEEVARFAQGGQSAVGVADAISELVATGLSVQEAIKEFGGLRQEVGLTYDEIQQLSTSLSGANAVLEAIGINAFEASVQGAEFAQQLIDASNGLEAFAASGSNFFNTFIDTRTEAETLSDVFTDLGFALPSTADGLVALVQGLDLTTEEGQNAFAIITALTDALSRFYEAQENEAEQTAAELLRIEQDLADRRIALNQSISDRLGELGLDEFQLALLRLDREFAILREEAEETGGDLVAIEELYAALRQQILDEQLASQLEAQRELVALEEQAASEQARIREQSLRESAAVTDSAFTELSNAVSRQQRLLSDALREDLELIENTGQRALDRLAISAERAGDNISSLSGLFDDINRTVRDLIPLSRGQAQTQIQSALSTARSGGSLVGVDLSQALSSISEPSENLFGSFEDYLRDFNDTNAALSELGNLTGAQLTNEQRTLNSINEQIDATERDTQLQLDQRQSLFDREFTLLDEQLVNAREQIDILRGVDTTLLSIGDSQIALNDAIANESMLLESINETLAEIQTPSTPPVVESEQSTSVDVGSTDSGQTSTDNTALLNSINNSLKLMSRNSERLYLQIDRWDGDGLPATRNEVP